MKFEKFTGPGSTAPRRKFWDDVFAATLAARKLAGSNVKISEFENSGTIIDVTRERSSSACIHINTVTIVTAGSSYHAGTFLLPGESPPVGVLCPPANDFAFRLHIDAVDGGGAVTAFTITGGLVYPYPGLGMLIPFNNPVSFGDSGGFGTGFTANCTWA